MKPNRIRITVVAVLWCVTGCMGLLATPAAAAGRVWVVAQGHAEADDAGPGTAEKPFRSIAPAAAAAQPGDTVRVHAGVYRERVSPARGGRAEQPITYEAAPGERVVLRGSDRFEPAWEARHERHPRVLAATLPESLFPDGRNPFAVALLRPAFGSGRTLGQVFVDGEPLLEVTSEADLLRLTGTWTVDEAGRTIRVHFPQSSTPVADRVVELTVRERVFAPKVRGLGHIHVRGFIMEHAANQFPSGFWTSESPQAGLLGTRGGHHWVIEHNTIRLAKGIGLDIGSEGSHDADGLDQPMPDDAGQHVIQHNTISDNGACGIAGYRSTGTRIRFNVIERNNTLGFTAPEAAGIKLHFFYDGLIESNLVRDNDASGIWLDNRYRGSRVTRNVLIGNTGANLFIELGSGPVMVDHNIIACARAGANLAGDGVYAHDASGVTLAHNLIYFNANFGVWTHIGTDRRGGRTTSSDWRIVNNLILGNHQGTISFPPVTPRSKGNQSDHNILAGPYDRMTSETHARGLDGPLFRVNSNKQRVTDEALAALIRDRLSEAGVPEAQWPRMGPATASPDLTMAQWRIVTGNDRHSRHARVLRTMLASRGPAVKLTFMIDDTPREVAGPRFDELTHDFFGEPFGAQTPPLPGPFQKLRTEPALSGPTQDTPFRGPFNGIVTTQENSNHLIVWPQQ